MPGGAKRRIGGAGHLKEARRTDDEPIPFGGCTGISDIKKRAACSLAREEQQPSNQLARMSARGLTVRQPKARTFGDIKIPTEVTTDRTDTSRSERLRTFLDPLYGYSTLEKAKRGPRADPRKMGTCTNATGGMKTRRVRDRSGNHVVSYQTRVGIPLTARKWNPQETERCFVTENMQQFRHMREDPNGRDRRHGNLHKMQKHEKMFRLNGTAGVIGKPGHCCSHSFSEIASKEQEYINCLSRK